MGLILMRNIDVIHQERNVGKSLINTCLNIIGKKYNSKASKDLALIFNWPTLELGETGGKPVLIIVWNLKGRKK